MDVEIAHDDVDGEPLMNDRERKAVGFVLGEFFE